MLKAQSKINDLEAEKDRLIKFILFEWVSICALFCSDQYQTAYFKKQTTSTFADYKNRNF